MNRIMIIGFSGAGKSTLARQLGERLAITPTHMDRLHWKPGWQERTMEEKTALLTPVLKQERWIIDGSYRNVLYQERLTQCDTLIFMDFNRFLCFFRIWKRLLMYRGKNRPDMGEGCTEKVDLEFIQWVLWTGRKKRRRILTELSQLSGKNVYIFRRPKQVKAFLEQVSKQPEYRKD